MLGLSVAEFVAEPSVVNGLAVAVDAVSTIVPIVPAGGGVAIRALSKADDLVKVVGKADDAAQSATQVIEKAVEAPKALPPSPYSNPVNPWKGNIVSAEAKGGEVWYRVFDNVNAKQMGGWVTPIRPSTSSEAIRSLNLPNNQATLLTEVRPPAGTGFQIGQASVGGGLQIQLLDRVPAKNWGPVAPLPKALLPAPKAKME